MNNTTYHIIRIQQYLKGELSTEEMNQLEREALEDPFLNDALEGYQHVGMSTNKLTLLQQRLQDRVTEQPQERSRLLFTSQRLGIAAAACLLFILACVLLWMINTRNDTIRQRQVTVELNTAEPIPYSDGSFIARKLTQTSASPKQGWNHFNRYIKENIKALKGKNVVVLTFDIDNQGKPFHIRSEKGDKPFIEEAKRLIEVGPTWDENKSAKVEFVFE
ncbi:hypothetical protein GCM10023231_07470 [Olivibacter ginsenosidimutans]|uniref:TonB C-terminal domain-containing protein n=1 Tax=Olivibacter ginsenosidimutans TaxID=1176537 RepID=A0ABP9AKS8_9SPHI